MSSIIVSKNPNVAPKAVFIGSSSLAAALSGGAVTLNATSSGSSSFVAVPETLAPIAVSFAGASSFSAAMRIDNEPNVLLEALFAGSSSFAPAPRVKISLGALFAGSGEFAAVPVNDNALADELTVFATILPEAFAVSNFQNYRARLLVDSIEVPIKSFEFSAPANSLGSSLSIELARGDLPAQITRTSEIEFELGFWSSALLDYVTHNLIAGGKMSGKNYSIAFSGDRLTFTAESSLSELMTKAPGVPFVLYDSNRLDLSSEVDSVQTSSGERIETVFEPVAGLRLHTVLERAYKTGLGFSDVKTNLPNYKISRVDFTFESGFHSACKSLIGMFEPLFFTGENNELWILDATAPMPSNFAAREISASNYKTLALKSPSARVPDALLVVLNDESSGDYFTTRTETPPAQSSGTFGTANYTRLEFEKKIREYRNLAAPGVILRELTERLETTTLNNTLEIIGREIETISFDGLGRKTGHTIEREALVPGVPSGSLSLQETETETQLVAYSQHPFKRREQFVSRIETRIEGLVLVDSTATYLGEPVRIQAIDAHRGFFFNSDNEQTLERATISTEIKTFSIDKAGQITERVRFVDHLSGNGLPARSRSNTFAGDIGSGSFAPPRKLLVSLSDIAAPELVESFATGELDFKNAVALAKRNLTRRSRGCSTLLLEIIGLDLLVSRGALVKALNRTGASLGSFITTGFRYSGDNLDTREPEYKTSLEGDEL